MVSQDDADTSSHTTDRMSSSKARVQIIGRVSGRRNWTVEQKLAIIGEAFTSGSSVANTIERHEISSGQLYT
ncbi:MAG: transposase [Methylocella sp.]